MTIELFTHGFDNQNEDYCKVAEYEGRTIIVMADGMGGLAFGADAAKCVCESLLDYIIQNIDDEDMWQFAFEYADGKLRELSLTNRSDMGAAVTALIVTNWSYEVAWQGNIRLYIQRDDKLRQVTTDHVIDTGYGKKMLTRCLKGGGLRGEVPNFILPLQLGDTLYLCTDGFYNVLDSDISKDYFMSKPNVSTFTDDSSCLTIKN